MPAFQRAAIAAFSLTIAGLLSPALADVHSHNKPKPAGPTANVGEYRIGDIVIRQPWTRATPKGAAVGGGYATIVNTGTTPDRLVDGSFAFAGRFEIHEMAVSDGVMRMRHLQRGIEIKPGATVVLKPGGYHLMFMQLREPIMAGRPVKGTLVFEKAGKVEVQFVAAPMGSRQMPAPSGHGDGDHGSHKHH